MMKRYNPLFQPTFCDRNFCKRLAALLCGVTFVLGFAFLVSRPAAGQIRIGLPGMFNGAKHHPDFDGDGYADLAIAAPFEPLGNVARAGAVHVLYGSPNGMAWPRNQLLQRSSTRPDQDADRDGFGEVILWGDFNGDGYDDLAVGIPNAVDNTGHVNVYYGGPSGLQAAAPQIWTRHALRGTDRSGEEVQFGINLVAGDFNGDGYADLAVVGLLGRYPPFNTAGIVHIVYGSANGLRADGNQIIPEGQPILSMEAGDFNRDGCAELAIGVPESVRTQDNSQWTSGAVHIYAGSRSGLIVSWISQIFTELSAGMQNGAGIIGGFGTTMTTGDFNGDGYPDLAISAVNYSLSPTEKVHVLYGGRFFGLSTIGNQVIEGLEPVSALTSGDFDGDGFSDLVIGMPFASVHRRTNLGIVRVVYGTRFGVTPPSSHNTQEWTRFSPGILDGVSIGMLFGTTLLAADFTNSGHDALAIGAPWDHGVTGSVNVLFSSSAGLSANGNQIVMVGHEGVLGTVAENFNFGNLRGGSWYWPALF